MRIAIMTLVVAASAAIGMPSASAGYIHSVPYCARAYDGATDCAYFTLWQCRMAVSATGGDCALNPRYAGEPVRPVRKPRRVVR